VRSVRKSVDIDDVRRHVRAGKQCTRLAMTWADRVSFVLTDALDVKRVAPLDVLKENAELAATTDQDQHDADMALMTGELSKLITDLVDALGGEKQTR
jgi:recombination associated protein RdgC